MYPLIYTVVLYNHDYFLGVLGSATSYDEAERLIYEYAGGHYVSHSAGDEYTIFGMREDRKVIHACIIDNYLH